MLAVIFALLAAIANALASTLQRRAARRTPEEESFRPALILDLLRQKAWLGGIGALIAGFLLQAAALSQGALALVQPLLALELPATMFAATRILHAKVGRRVWIGASVMAAGLALALFALSPGEGSQRVSTVAWIAGVAGSVGAIAVLVGVGKVRPQGPSRAAILGASAGLGFGLTAALMKAATKGVNHGIVGVFTTWQLYGMVAAGIGSLFLLQNALQSGTLAAAQPAITVVDPIVGVVLGVTLFHEPVRLGPWIIAEIVGFVAIALGSVELARSPALNAAAVRER